MTPHHTSLPNPTYTHPGRGVVLGNSGACSLSPEGGYNGKVQAGFPGRRPFGTGRVFLGSNLDSVELVPDLLLRWAPERKRANEILSIRHKAH